MALVSPKMSLRVWDQFSDPYNHDQLADNWSKVDLHDHTPGRGVLIPTEGIADGAITTSKLSADLSSQNNGVYRTLYQLNAGLATGAVVGTYFFTASGSAIASPGSSGTISADFFTFVPADYAVVGKTTSLRIRLGLIVNTATAALSTYAAGLYPATAFGGGGAIGLSLGALVTGSSTTSIVNPAASSVNSVVGSDFVAPTAGTYALAVAVSAATTATPVVIYSQLQIHHT